MERGMISGTLTLPVFWDALRVRMRFTGEDGKFRLPRAMLLIPLSDDIAAIDAWMESSARYSSFRRVRQAMEKFVNWSWLVRFKAVSSLAAEDFQAYGAFLHDPQPRNIWQSGSKVHRTNPAWRPFVGGLSSESVQQDLGFVKALVGWLADIGYARLEFVAGDRDFRSKLIRMGNMPSRASRLAEPPVLHIADVGTVWNALGECKPAIRSRVQVQFLLQYLCGMKSTEVARLKYGDIRMPSEGPWLLHVPGRADDVSLLALFPPLRDSLREYLVSNVRTREESLLGVTESDISKANKRLFETAAALCAISPAGDIAGNRLCDLPGSSLRYAFAVHAYSVGALHHAWQMAAVRRMALPGGLHEPGMTPREPIDPQNFSLACVAVSPVLELLKLD